MPLTCKHDVSKSGIIPGEPWRKGQCAVCWKAVNSEVYAKHQEDLESGRVKVHGHEGPPIKPAWQWGDKLKAAIDKTGFTQEWLTEKLGSCFGCPERQAALNAAGAWAHEVIHNNLPNAARHLYRIFGEEGPPMKWAYGVTTVPGRLAEVLPPTIKSLAAAGFDKPRLFVDGGDAVNYRQFNLEVTAHNPKLRAYGAWYMALLELSIREPSADRYAIFQDDILLCRNTRQYLETSPMPEKSYLNLYTHLINESSNRGWYRGCLLANTDPLKQHFQRGIGALALVFDRAGVEVLLSSDHMAGRPRDADRGWRNIDGAVVTAMNKANYHEYVHMPSLVWHTGLVSTVDPRKPASKPATSWPGEKFDAMEFTKQTAVGVAS